MKAKREGRTVSDLFGAVVRLKRVKLGLSQEELGFRARLHRTYIADIERGARNPSLASVARLAEALQVSLSDLFARMTVLPDQAVLGDKSTTSEHDWRNSQIVEILLVEDDRHDAELAIQALKECNFTNRIHVVTDGVQALNFIFPGGGQLEGAPRRRPHVILLDLQLPKLSGLEVLQRIKTDPTCRRIPVIVLTSSREEANLAESRRLGADDYIVKPVDFQQFSHSMPRVGLRWLLLTGRQRESRRMQLKTKT